MIYVYNSDLEKIGIVDTYKSLITAKRYRENGDCEIYMPASAEALDLLRIGRYVGKTDDSTIYRINKVVLATSGEDGNYLTVSGLDAKAFLDQRIVMETSVANGNAEQFALGLISAALVTDADRAIKDSHGTVIIDTEVTGLTETLKEQVSYKNVGEKIREYCQKFGWGYKAELNENKIVFSFYKGTDRSALVVFSPAYENVSTSEYEKDRTNMGNFALVAGSGEGSERIKETVGTTTGADRYEVFVDAKSLSRKLTYKEIVTAYPNGTIQPDGGKYYYVVSGDIIAETPSASPQDNDTCELAEDIYRTQLDSQGAEKLSQFGEVTSFQSEIIPDVTWVYGQDYFLGDIVRIDNEFGIAVNARITEIVEVEDENGYSTQPTFELITEV